MTSTVTKLTWILALLKELSVNVTLPVQIFGDRKSVSQIAGNPVFYERTKHIEID